MILFPAIDLKDGQCVRLKLGDMVVLANLVEKAAAALADYDVEILEKQVGFEVGLRHSIEER